MVDVDRMRADLLTARKARDKAVEAALKRALAAFDNAGAVPVTSRATEVPRRELSDADYVQLIRAEIEEAETAAQQYEAGGRADAAAQLRAESAVLERYLQ
jgi:uncharacterized protein YqeY